MLIEELLEYAAKLKDRDKPGKHAIKVCSAAGCLSLKSDAVSEELKKKITEAGLEEECWVKPVGCLGLCSKGPLVTVDSDSKVYQEVKPADAGRIIAKAAETVTKETDPFFTRQQKIVLENSGQVDPEKIHDYILRDGYLALYEVLEMTPQEVIDEVTISGLRGRGGAGYPTGLKWNTVAKTGNVGKYVICNADEGDPGAFMDRSVLEGDPHRVLEGMAIAAFAVGATEGYVYVRAEYPLAIKRLKNAIKQAERAGVLGKNIFGTTFSFTVEIRIGAGAFVCGEETALIASIEGKRGQPRPRPPYPAQVGLWGSPTLINNVETYANIAPILRHGGEWYAAIGTEKSKGTKVFALAGKINNTGLIEVPMGTKLRDVIYDIGGGIPDGKKFKAVQTGGPSGGCIPEQFLDQPIDYESLGALGSIMGSGGMIIMDETSCMVDVAKYFLDFTKDESCGKCVPCRVGTVQLYNILDRITKGEGTMEDLDELDDLCDLVKNTSLCGLGQAAPNPVLSTIQYFRDEYIAHIVEKRCPAGVCKIHKGERKQKEEVMA